MASHKGWQEVLRPFLLAKRDQSFPDPSQFTKEEEFVYAARVASVYKKVIAELLMIVEQYEDTYEGLMKKQRGEIKDTFSIGEE